MSLIEAVYQGDLAKVKSLLNAGADAHQTEDDAKITPLHFAVVYDREENACGVEGSGALSLVDARNPFHAEARNQH